MRQLAGNRLRDDRCLIPGVSSSFITSFRHALGPTEPCFQCLVDKAALFMVINQLVPPEPRICLYKLQNVVVKWLTLLRIQESGF
jgi:hypothetical protein